jgi:HEAT repeat protein
VLISKLNDPSVTIQTMVAEALGNFKRRDLAKHLVPLLKRENKYLVIAVMESLGKLHAAETINDIIPLLDHPVAEVRKTAAKVLGEF